MNGVAEKIINALTIEDVLRMYGYGTSPKGRIPCPIHKGKHNNFCYTEKVYHCWSCGAKGDLITLAMELNGITFPQAITKLNYDFSLGIVNKKPSLRERQEITLNNKISKVAEALKSDLSDYYSKVTDIHRGLFKVRCSSDFKADEAKLIDYYISSSERWLDDNIEGVMYPWVP